jgi:hypothetical protein
MLKAPKFFFFEIKAPKSLWRVLGIDRQKWQTDYLELGKYAIWAVVE